MVDPLRQALILAILLLATPWASADFAVWEGPETSPDDASLSPSTSTYDGFRIPSNATITGATFEVAPEWVEAEDNGTYWAKDSPGGFSAGTSNGTSYLSHGGDLTLEAQSIYGRMTDFESQSPQFSSWSVHGDLIWIPVNLSVETFGPTNASSGHYAAGTNGSVPPDTRSKLRSQFWNPPAVIRNMSVSFDRWFLLNPYDLATFEASFDSGQSWTELDNWSGQEENWTREEYPLDAYSVSSQIGFRFTISTAQNSTTTEGLFIDNFEFSNQGEPISAWFHGNASGEYSANADGSLIIPLDLGGLNGPIEFVYWSWWDIEADYNDNLVMMISVDNGSTWTIMSPLPGVPGLGVPSGSGTLTQQSYDWVEIMHPLPSNVIGHSNASQTLLKLRVTTDGIKNNGGSAIEGWEGIIVDDLALRMPGGDIALNNFTDVSTQYLENVSGYPNDWQHITWEGHNGPWSTTESFESNQMLPAGWRIDHKRGNTPWEAGAINNSNNRGPYSSGWPSGQNGVGINLDGNYAHSTLTHLISPNYHLPIGATARLSFQHWICTEAAWDGGAVFTSIDDGISWQYFGENQSGFYERISQVNSNSPLFGHEIFDGSTVVNGCGNNNSAHTFSSNSADISFLAGNDVRIRFTFFSDAYVSESGWYIDDAGIEIDRFVSNGTWLSPIIDVDEAGWARLASLFHTPNETGISIDILDQYGAEIPDKQNLSLPFTIGIGAWEHTKLQFRVNMWSQNESITPRIEILHHGITEYINQYHPLIIESESENPELIIGANGSVNLVNTSGGSTFFEFPIIPWRPFESARISCDGEMDLELWNLYKYLEGGGQSQGGQPQQQQVSAGCNVGEINFNEVVGVSIINPRLNDGWFNWLKFEPVTLRAPKNVSINFGNNNHSEFIIPNLYAHTTQITKLITDGEETNFSDPRGFEVDYNSSFSFSTTVLDDHDISNQYHWVTNQSSCAMIVSPYEGCISGSITEKYQEEINGTLYRWMNITWSQTNLTPGTLKLIAISAVADQPFEFALAPSALTPLMVDQGDGTSILPVNITVLRGGVIFDGIIDYEVSIFDKWQSMPEQTLYPGNSVQAKSNHSILNGTSPLESVELIISSSRNASDALASFAVDNLDIGGRFIQHSGGGLISINASLSSWDGENATWGLNSHWLLDDYPRLYWLVSAKNELGITLGPAVGMTGSGGYAASTNDLEIVGFSASTSNYDLGDFADPLWPFHLQGGTNITVDGQVRFSGLQGIVPLPEDVEIELEIFDENQSYQTLSVVLDSDGTFSTSFFSPGAQLNSGDTFTVIPSLNRVGPQGIVTAVDVTADYQKITYLLDSVNAEVISLHVVAPGGIQPADGHVWFHGQDLPLRLGISDDNGLPATMVMHYSRSGRDWEEMTFTTPIGLSSAEIDLPLIDEYSIPLNSQLNGYLDVYFTGTDLAGNPMIGGGNESIPLARVLIQDRYSTYAEGEDLGLDLVDGYLLPGNTHKFEFSITDNNGIESLDLIKFGLQQEGCTIQWYPWSGEVINDVSCFIRPPRINYTQVGESGLYFVNIQFELRWDLEEDLPSSTLTPWLHIYDENARTGAGYNSMTPLNWQFHSGVDFVIESAEDLIAPKGELIDDIIYVHDQDLVDFELIAYHAGTDIPAHNLPFNTNALLRMDGNTNHTDLENSMNSDGTSTIRVMVDQSYLGKQIYVLVSLSELRGHNLSSDSATIVIDDSEPTLSITDGYLVEIRTDSLADIPVELTVYDLESSSNSEVNMYWQFIRSGRIISGTEGSASVPALFSDSQSTIHSTNIDMSAASPFLEKGDSILVWFEGEDSSGRTIIGEGASQSSPIMPFLRWIAYEPELGEIITTPYRPELGDMIQIHLTIFNPGFESGHSYLTLRDGTGKMLDKVNLSVGIGQRVPYSFEIEAWTVGDLGLTVQIDEQSPVPVPLAQVVEPIDENAASQSTMVSLGFFSIAIAGFALFLSYHNKRSDRLVDDEEE